MIQYEPWSDGVIKDLIQQASKGIFTCLDLELGGECPYNCVYCETPYRDKKAKIDIDKICMLLDKKQFRWVYICGIGEPTYGRNEEQLLRILKRCEENNVKCSIFTNVSNLSKALIDYIEKGVLYCIFKFDSRSPEIISELYNSYNLGEHLHNIEKLVSLVKCNGKVTNIAASIVPNKKNVDEIPDLVQWCIERQIFPLVAQLEYAGSAKEVFDKIVLDDRALEKLKSKINGILDEEYRVPFCPAVFSGFCITYDNKIVIDRRTGLSCHSFWLEDPMRDIVCSDISDLLSIDDITKKMIKARVERYENFRENKEQYTFDVFGGCGGNKMDIFNLYEKIMKESYFSHPSNNDNLKINRFVYLDNNATTIISKSVYEKMKPYLKKNFMNPNSNSQIGRNIRAETEKARSQIAEILACKSEEIYFTSCGSESNSWAIKSCLHNAKMRKKRKILSTAIEHESILEYLSMLKTQGYEIENIPISKNGNIDIDSFLATPPKWEEVCFATVMFVNNETGVINDIKRLTEILHRHKIPLHCDAVQAFGKIRINVKDIGADYMSFSGHKIHAPKGIGALYVREKANLYPLIFGNQERGKRGGTENVAYIVAFGEAAEKAYSNDKLSFEKRIKRIRCYRDKIEDCLESKIEGVIINGKETERVANTSNIGFYGIDAMKLSLILESRGIYVSNGAACNTVNPQQSHVLEAMMSPAYEKGAIRVSLSEYTEERDIDYFLDNLIESIKKVKGE